MLRHRTASAPAFVLELNRDARTPLATQVAEGIRRRIAGGHLPAATRLPASRALARELGVARNTVLAAYEALIAEGWLEGAVGRGTFVSERAPRTPRVQRPAGGAEAFAWGPLAVRAVARSRLAPPGSADAVDLSGGIPDPSTYPADRMRAVLDDVLARHGAGALGYGPPAGHGPLREHIATRATRLGSAVNPEDVLVVSGLQQGLDLLARLLLAPGDTVAVETPTYSNALGIWRFYGASPVGVEMDARGLVPESLARVVRQHRPKFVYVMPAFQNPTGITMDAERRADIVRVAAETDVALVEDHFDTELRYRGRALPPLRAHDRRGQVVLLGTFSKILFPGFRLGWIIAPPELRARLLDVKRVTELATSLPVQMAVAAFCELGELDRHLDRVRRDLGARLDAMLETLVEHVPASVTYTRPEGGMTLWVTLPEGARSGELVEAAAREGVLVADGRWFMPEGDGERNLRLSFVNEPPERIRRGVEILGGVIARHLALDRPSGRGRGPGPDESEPFL